MKKDHTITTQLNTQFVEKRPYFWWWVRDKKALSVESVVEGVLAYGNMNNVYNLFRSHFKISPQAQFLCWAEGLNTRNIKYIPAVESLEPP